MNLTWRLFTFMSLTILGHMWWSHNLNVNSGQFKGKKPSVLYTQGEKAYNFNDSNFLKMLIISYFFQNPVLFILSSLNWHTHTHTHTHTHIILIGEYVWEEWCNNYFKLTTSDFAFASLYFKTLHFNFKSYKVCQRLRLAVDCIPIWLLV